MLRKCVIAAVAVALIPAAAVADGIFQSSYPETFSFRDAAALEQTRMNAAFDGSHYWSSSGGSPGGNRLAEYDAAGTLLNLYQPGIDLRSVFTNSNTPPLFARGYGSRDIQVQIAPGVFGPHVTLSGGSLDSQSSVVLHTDGSGNYIAMSAGGQMNAWDAGGTHVGASTLIGFGSMFSEDNYPANRGVASAVGYYLTYSEGHLSAWDAAGTRVGHTVLTGAGTSFDSHFSTSFANNMVFVVDSPGGMWRGYFIPEIPEPATLSLLGIGGLLAIRRRR